MPLSRQVVEVQASRVEKLIPTSGFASLDDLATAVSQMGPERARAVKLLKDEHNFEFVMNVYVQLPLRARPKYGYLRPSGAAA